MMFLHTLASRFKRELASLIEGRKLNAGDVVLNWDGATAPADRNKESDYAARVPQSETVGALIHWVSVRTGDRGAFTEIQSGDAIVTFTNDVTIDGRRGLYFTLPDGKDYVQAVTGKSVVEFWDAYVGGEPLSITLLLRRK